MGPVALHLCIAGMAKKVPLKLGGMHLQLQQPLKRKMDRTRPTRPPLLPLPHSPSQIGGLHLSALSALVCGGSSVSSSSAMLEQATDLDAVFFYVITRRGRGTRGQGGRGGQVLLFCFRPILCLLLFFAFGRRRCRQRLERVDRLRAFVGRPARGPPLAHNNNEQQQVVRPGWGIFSLPKFRKMSFPKILRNWD